MPDDDDNGMQQQQDRDRMRAEQDLKDIIEREQKLGHLTQSETHFLKWGCGIPAGKGSGRN